MPVDDWIAMVERDAIKAREFGAIVDEAYAVKYDDFAVIAKTIAEGIGRTLYLAGGQEQHDREPDPPPPRLADVHHSIAAPRPGPRAGTALAAA